ncbi:MAG: hypothetical protein UR28_C0007G0016 [Candidatus Peregrinibacteria bacterium GW2011_GWF2_33_10]|nr:MAG: hypothetical protein UR28_C0007G0016 [Candidatus Peregrinibacteria bacterium GW2011_GWF2_33_10]OGJ44247.1 MAG: hypothetical protein A2272_04125 [Candidatus Peregrinibacteria bacterium RIFOXYA12_FULL_33_12]OGJ44905.1 MAG: hypothetical protein A2263_03190 [Candidatus Peregrinibacteria bacterium RIFOXYA2_FULL_33_21]OGJ50664.1 MAG: hypothetical protein A2307_03480 [Candidatus Peregrinibacteria bacterium RIFOXYB2_FULL_33_20]
MNLFQVHLISKKTLTHDVYEFIFELIEPKEIIFQTGQFVMLQIPTEKGFLQKRAYSIASPEYEKNKLIFIIKFIEGGFASAYLKKMKVGDFVTFQGPLGRFVLHEGDHKNLLFIATGTGLAPFIAMTKQIFQTMDKTATNHRIIELFFGVRYEEDIFYQDMLENFAKTYPNFQFHITVSRAKENYSGWHGRITSHLDVNKYDRNNTAVYLCGSGAMVNEIKEMFLKSNFNPENLHAEMFHV